MLLPEDCRCFAVPCPDTDSMSNRQQRTKQDCYRVKVLFLSWDLIISLLLCLDSTQWLTLFCISVSGAKMLDFCSLLWGLKIILFPFSPTKYMSSCPQWILTSAWTSKCCAFTQKEIIFRGNLFFIRGIHPAEQTERPSAFVSAPVWPSKASFKW